MIFDNWTIEQKKDSSTEIVDSVISVVNPIEPEKKTIKDDE
jgi:hypothetical protein